MATPTTEVKLDNNKSEPSEPLTSVTHQEQLSVPDGHEVSIESNGEVLVNTAPVAFNDKEGDVIPIDPNTTDGKKAQPESTVSNTEGNNGPAVESVQNVSSNGAATEESSPLATVNGPEESKQPTNTAGASFPSDCMLDCTTTLIANQETTPKERATQDEPILPNQPEIGPTVFRPRRPPPPRELPLQISVDVQPSLQASPSVTAGLQSPSAAHREEVNKKSRSLNRVKSFGASVRNVFTNVKSSVLRKKNRKTTKRTHPNRDHPNDHGLPTNRMGVEASHETHSLHSSTWASNNSSAINTPQLARKHEALQQAIPDLLKAMEPGLQDPNAKVHDDTSKDHARGQNVYAGRPVGFRSGASLDRRQNNTTARNPVTLEIRRTQTMRTPDYAGRLRDRIRTYRPESVEASSPGDFKRQTFGNSSVFVRSDHISWPPKFFKSKRQSGKPPQTVYSHGQEPGGKQTSPSSLRYDAEANARLSGQVQIEPPVMIHSTAPQRISLHLSKEEPVNAPGLTSLQSEERMTLLQLATKGSPTKVNMVSNQAVHSKIPPIQITALPYFSNDLTEKMESLGSDVKVALKNCINEVHPFLVTWDPCSQSTEDQSANLQESWKASITCLQTFLAACIKLRSVDLQGQYAPFHYPLKGCNAKLWERCAILENFQEINILREPKWNTEYVELASIMKSNNSEQKIFHVDRPVDTLLTTWLDCHETLRASTAGPAGSSGKCIYHPVQLVARLDQVLGLEQSLTLMDHCLRLAVLLAYNYIKQYYVQLNQEVHLNTDAKNILLLMSTSDCLVMFSHKEEKKEPETVEKSGGDDAKEKEVTESENKPAVPEANGVKQEEQQVEENTLDPEQLLLLQSTKCDAYTSDEKAIDGVIAEIRQYTEGKLTQNSLSAPLIKAIAPPDWIAMTLARVCISKQ